MMGYLYLVLSSVCSLIIAHLLKLTEVKELRTINTLTVNYIFAGLFALLFGFNNGEAGIPGTSIYLLLFCTVVGAFFIGNFLAYSKSVHANGVGITITAMRLSLLVPLLISVFWYTEYLGTLKIIGVIIVFGAMVLLIPKKNNMKFGSVSASWLLLIIFILSGFADASLKIYHEEFSTTLNELTFMGLIFLCAFLIGLGLCIFRRGPIITQKEALLGAAIGIPNLYSAVFLIYALESITGSIAYPVVNILNVLGGTFLGLLIWDDNVTTKQWAGIAAAILAILLLI